jgi:ATP-dependent Lon protease
MHEIILCEDNRKDVEEINADFLKGLTFHYVSTMRDVIELALSKQYVKNPVKLEIPAKRRSELKELEPMS